MKSQTQQDHTSVCHADLDRLAEQLNKRASKTCQTAISSTPDLQEQTQAALATTGGS